MNADPTALLYQTGYLTIADYDRETLTVGLKVPNLEVRRGLFNDLAKLYVKVKGDTLKNVLDGIKDSGSELISHQKKAESKAGKSNLNRC